MKILKLFLPVLILGTIFSACKNNSESGEAGDGSYTLSLTLKDGETFAQNTRTDMKMQMNIMGKDNTMNLSSEAGTDMQLIKDSADTKEIKLTYTKMINHIDMGAMGMGKNMDSVMNRQQERMVGKSLTMKLVNNKITDVSGGDAVFTNGDSAQQAIMKGMMSKENLNNMFGQLLNIYPEKPVSVGDSWKSTTSMNMNGMQMSIDTKYLLQSVEGNIANIKVTGVLKTDGKMSLPGNPMEIDVKMTGDQSGNIQMMIDKGVVTKGNFTTKIKGDMEVMGQKIKMTMDMDQGYSGGMK